MQRAYSIGFLHFLFYLKEKFYNTKIYLKGVKNMVLKKILEVARCVLNVALAIAIILNL